MKRIIQVFILLLGVTLYSQDTLSVKDGAYGYDKDFNLDLHLTTASDIKALQFDVKFDGNNFEYKSSYNLNKARLGGDDSDHVITVREVGTNSNNKTEKLRILIYSPSNKNIPTGSGKLLDFAFANNKNYGNYNFELLSVVASKPDNTNLSLKLNNGTITTLASHIYYNLGTVDLGSVYKDEVKEFEWTISNEGTDTLSVTLDKSELNKFTLTEWSDKSTPISWPLTILPVGEGNNNNARINVTVNSSANGTFEESLFLNSNDPNDSRKGVKEIKFKAVVYNENRVVVQKNAKAENKITSDVKVSINGDENITSFQFDITTDQQSKRIELISGSASLLKSGTDHVISSNVRTDENGNKFLRVVAYSPSNAVLTQPIGEIVKFSVRPDKIKDPGEYSLNINNVVLTNKDLTNVSSASENGSVALVTGRFNFVNPVFLSNDQQTLNFGELFRNSFNEKSVPFENNGNRKLIIKSVSSANTDFSIKSTLPIEVDPAGSSNVEFNLVPTSTDENFSAYLKFSHDGGNELDSVLVKATLKNRNIVVMKNTQVSKAATTNIPISVLNSNEIKGVQFDVTVPSEKKSFTWTLTADSNEDFNFAEISGSKDPGITHYVGDDINFVNNSGTTHPLYIVTGLGDDGGYDATKQLTGVTNQGATSGTIKVDLSDVAPGTYY